MSPPDVTKIERLLSDFAWLADRGDGTALAQLFLPEAILIVGGVRLVGRAEIAEDCRRRALDPLRKTRHVWSNLRVIQEADGTIAGNAVQLTFEQTGSNGAKLRINDITDRYEVDSVGTWCFKSRIIERQMALEL
jgi:SnoaL-like domain